MRYALLFVMALPAFPQGSVARGDKLFAQGCAVGYCHGSGGTAARAQRLRGRTFDREYLIKVIRDGLPNTAMPAWGDRLTDPDIAALADYIQSLANASADVAPPVVVDAATPAAPDLASATPPEHQRGRELFFDATREARCAACHRLNGIGAPVGPDLLKSGAIKISDGPRVIKYGRPRAVRTVVLKDGDKFPGVAVERNGTRYYDLSPLPPVLRSLTQADIQIVQRQTTWRHLTATRSYTLEDMQAVWNYVRWVAAKH